VAAGDREENSDMEMHSQHSLYEVHGISVRPRRRQSRLIVWSVITRIFVFLTEMKQAFQAELATRRAMTELAQLDDRMLRDLGIARCEIANKVRQPRANVGTDDASVPPPGASERIAALPSVNSPDLASEAPAGSEPRKLRVSR
jgi:uncharacterized protein YjiS (DUF1127 family)